MSTSEYSLDEQLYLFRHEAWTGATRYLELKTNADGLRYVHEVFHRAPNKNENW